MAKVKFNDLVEKFKKVVFEAEKENFVETPVVETPVEETPAVDEKAELEQKIKDLEAENAKFLEKIAELEGANTEMSSQNETLKNEVTELSKQPVTTPIVVEGEKTSKTMKFLNNLKK